MQACGNKCPRLRRLHHHGVEVGIEASLKDADATDASSLVDVHPKVGLKHRSESTQVRSPDIRRDSLQRFRSSIREIGGRYSFRERDGTGHLLREIEVAGRRSRHVQVNGWLRRKGRSRQLDGSLIIGWLWND